MKNLSSWRVAVLWLALLPTLSLRAQQHPFELADLAKLTGLSDPQFSPDGTRIAVVTSTPDYAEDRYLTGVVLVAVPKGEQRVLAAGKNGLTQPRWSPSGQELAYLAKTGTDKDAQLQLFVQPLA
ncbi:MAG: TolB family protein, partial [Janthinobacterium lividum]